MVKTRREQGSIALAATRPEQPRQLSRLPAPRTTTSLITGLFSVWTEILLSTVRGVKFGEDEEALLRGNCGTVPTVKRPRSIGSFQRILSNVGKEVAVLRVAQPGNQSISRRGVCGTGGDWCFQLAAPSLRPCSLWHSVSPLEIWREPI